MGVFSLGHLKSEDMNRFWVVILSGLGMACDCDDTQLLLNQLDRIDRDIAKLVTEDLHFDYKYVHPVGGPSDFIIEENPLRKRSDDDTIMSGYMPMNPWADEKRSLGGWVDKKRSFDAFGRWIDPWTDEKRSVDDDSISGYIPMDQAWADEKRSLRGLVDRRKFDLLKRADNRRRSMLNQIRNMMQHPRSE